MLSAIPLRGQRLGSVSAHCISQAALHFMKISGIILFALLLVGCTSTQQTASLTADQAKAVAVRLANEKAAATYHRQPFHDWQPPRFGAGHWTWRQQGTGDIEATVELAADGSTNSVTINQLVDKIILP